MTSFSINAHVKKSRTFSEFVWFNGTVALKEGQGVCYEWNYEQDSGDSNKDDTVYDARRRNRVKIPTILNSQFFAGVAARPYSAKSGGQFIEIFLPGSTCNIWSTVSNTIGVGRTTCQAGAGIAGAGYFTLTGFPGRGSAIPLQTIDRGTPGLCMAYLEDGEESGLTENITDYAGAEAEAKVFMVGGVSYFGGTTATGAKTFALADGTKVGQKKGFFVRTTFSSEAVTVTPASTGVRLDGSTTLASFTMATAQDAIIVKWSGLGTGATWSTESLFATTEG